MIKILGKNYINDKEASYRYGYSISWFKKRRSEKKAPPFIKMQGKVLYDIHVVDTWFEDQINQKQCDND